MLKASLLLLALSPMSASSAFADDPAAPLPAFVVNPQFGADEPSLWHGLYVGGEIGATFGGHGHGAVGGDGFLGYNREFSNNLILGLQANAGFAPSAFARGAFRGYDFAGVSVKVGYDMGRFTPFVTGDLALAKPNALGGGGFSTAGESINDLFGSPGDAKTFASVGVGFDYAVTNHLSVGVSVSGGNGLATFP